MRVMLMVQTGDGRPKVSPTTARQRWMLLEHGERYCSGGVLPNLEHVRWWLVEAESAQEARVAIAYAKLIPGSTEFESMKDGHVARILASGGKP